MFLFKSNTLNQDGQDLLWKIPTDVDRAGAHVVHDEMLELFVHSVFWNSTNKLYDLSVASSYQILSAFSGTVFMLLLSLYAREIINSNKLLFMLLVSSGGFIQLFFGDVENYSITAVLVIWYLLVGIRVKPDRRKTVLYTRSIMLPALTIILSIVGFLYSRTYTPAWPGDFTAYPGAGYAIADGYNPCDELDVNRCLSRNGLAGAEALPFLYSPAFALPFSLAEYLGAVWVRRVWFAILHFAFWYGLFLLIRRRKQLKKSIILMAVLGSVFVFAGPYRATAKWGQVSALLFLSISIAITKKRNSAVSSVFLSLIPLIKPVLSAPLLALRRKAWLFFTGSILVIITISVASTGFEPWQQYASALNRVSSQWDLSIPGNRSLSGNVHRIFGFAFENSIRSSDSRQERIQRAGVVRTLSSLVSVILILLTLSVVPGCYRKSES
jgi:hypothetical protein